MSKRGQALVEFIIILPIFLMILLATVDVGRIMYSKITLEDTITMATELYQDGKNKEEILESINDDVSLEITSDVNFTKLSLTKEIDILTPGLNIIFNNPYHIKAVRSIDANA